MQAGNYSIVEIVEIKRNEVENEKSLLKGHWKKDQKPCCSDIEKLVEI